MTFPARASVRTGARSFRSGFTLLEILLVLGLISMLVGVLVTGSVRLLSDQPVTVEEVFWEAVNEARKDALLLQREVHLRYDADAQALIAHASTGARAFPLPPGEVQLDFLAPARRSTDFVLIGGILVETNPLTHVTFFEDGTCSPFRVQIRTGGPARMLAIDPWTCAPVLEPET